MIDAASNVRDSACFAFILDPLLRARWCARV